MTIYQERQGISIHALLAESDKLVKADTRKHFISIHALLAESDARRASRQQPAGISIHALLAESDQANAVDQILPGHISIHALLAESDGRHSANCQAMQGFLSTLSLRRATGGRVRQRNKLQFLSTLSLRRATFKPPIQTHRQKHFYPRSPCGERHGYVRYCIHAQEISIHALLAESDQVKQTCQAKISISIHALLAESDRRRTYQQGEEREFLSTLSLRRATIINSNCNLTQKFLSTLSLRRATFN